MRNFLTRERVLNLGTYAVGVAFFHVLMEWLFFMTKPSFMDSFGPVQKAGTLWIPFLGLWPLVLVVSCVFEAFGTRVCGRRDLGIVPVAFVLSLTVFLLVDNFLYTVFHFGGVARTNRYFGVVYLLIFLAILRAVWRKVQGVDAELRATGMPRVWERVAAVAVVMGLAALGAEISTLSPEGMIAPGRAAFRRPNVVFLAIDGIEADAVSVYGQKLKTTPYLEELARESLVFENAFPNAGKTTGATTAMLNGMLPSRTKVGFPPQVLPREYAFRHLPAILRTEGYRGFQHTIRHYADAYDLNMLGAFDRANGRDVYAPMPGSAGAWALYALGAERLFAGQLWERVRDRLLHITMIRSMKSVFIMASHNQGLGPKLDAQGLDDAMAFLRQEDRPFFMHLHLLSTHCCQFRGAAEPFSASDFPDAPPDKRAKMAARFNLLRKADGQIRTFVDRLRTEGYLDNTILVISSDHSMDWDSVERVPLIIRFPKGEHRGRVKRNTSLVQVAPTILNYMGLDVPEWMDGNPAFPGSEGEEPVFSLSRFNYKRDVPNGSLLVSQMMSPGPPLYGVAAAAGIFCDEWRKLDLHTGAVSSGKVHGHTGGCSRSRIPSDSEAGRILRGHLEERGFVLPPARAVSAATHSVHEK